MVGTVTAASGSGQGDDLAAAVDAALAGVADGLGDRRPDLAAVFLGARHTAGADKALRSVEGALAPTHVVGMTAGGVLAGPRELEDPSAIAVWAACLPGAGLAPLRYEAPSPATHENPAAAAAWPEPPEDAAAMVLLADPASFPASALLSWLDHVRPGLPVVGGMASGPPHPGGNRVLLDGEAHDDGAVAIALRGVTARTLVSQGCRPVGPSYTVTAAERNVLLGLAGAPPVQRLREVYAEAGEEDQRLMQTGLHIGVTIDEYRDELGPGDFLVRAVIGAEQDSDALVVGDHLEVGQTVQFHVRDADSADEDLRGLLDRDGAAAGAALLFTCNGRGQRLFGAADHDAALVHERLGRPALAGCFCAGEVGPVGARGYLHGFTASLLALDGT